MSLELPADIRQNVVDIGLPDFSTPPEVAAVLVVFSNRPEITVLLTADCLRVTFI